MIMNFFGHYHDHYKNYSDVTEKRQIIDLEGIFSPTDKQKVKFKFASIVIYYVRIIL